MTHLSDNAHFQILLEIVQNGAVADTDPEFLKSPRTAPFCDLQRRLTPVYNKHAATMHAANRVLILPIDQLTQSECADLHMANEYLWRAEPGRIAGRPLMDCSNAQPGIIPKQPNKWVSPDTRQSSCPPCVKSSRPGTNTGAPTPSNGATCGCSKQTSPTASINSTGNPTPPN